MRFLELTAVYSTQSYTNNSYDGLDSTHCFSSSPYLVTCCSSAISLGAVAPNRVPPCQAAAATKERASFASRLTSSWLDWILYGAI